VDDVEAIVEIVPERARRDRREQASGRGPDDAPGGGRPFRAACARIEQAHHERLRVGRQRVDAGDEERASAGDMLVRRRDGRHARRRVDADKRAALSRTLFVDAPRNPFLADAARPGEQDAGVHAGHEVHVPGEVANCRTGA
jgi:hypothetical protein